MPKGYSINLTRFYGLYLEKGFILYCMSYTIIYWTLQKWGFILKMQKENINSLSIIIIHL